GYTTLHGVIETLLLSILDPMSHIQRHDDRSVYGAHRTQERVMATITAGAACPQVSHGRRTNRRHQSIEITTGIYTNENGIIVDHPETQGIHTLSGQVDVGIEKILSREIH